jgi:hypothetical protein
MAADRATTPVFGPTEATWFGNAATGATITPKETSVPNGKVTKTGKKRRKA